MAESSGKPWMACGGSVRSDVKAVLWDFGGVITSSPFDAFKRYEAERGFPVDTIRRINATNPDSNAWARFERAEIDAVAFDSLFAEESAAVGHQIPGEDVLGLLSGDIRPAMVAAIDAIKVAGLRVGCITNNVPSGHGAGMARDEAKAAEIASIMARFDHVIESSKVGLRKPDPLIYLMMCDALGVAPHACVYLDDLGINCKPAAALGMRAIKVTEEKQALSELADMVGLALSA